MFRGRVRREIGDDLDPDLIVRTWIGGLFALLIGIPLAVVFWLSGEIPWGLHLIADPLIAFCNIFGVVLLYKAMRATLDYVRFGRVLLNIVGEHATVGGRLNAIVTLPPKAAAAKQVAAELVCWQIDLEDNDRLPASRELGQRMLGGTKAPIIWTSGKVEFPVRRRLATGTAAVVIPIPPGLPETDLRAVDHGPEFRGHHGWELRIGADVPGVDLARSFEVPVLAAPAGGNAT